MIFIGKKNLGYILTLVVLVIVLALSLFSLRIVSNTQKEVSASLEKRTLEYKNLLQRSKIPPTRDSLILASKKLFEVQDRYNHLKNLLSSKRTKQEVPVPLEFKEELLRIQRLLVERAKLYKISIPKPLGFIEYEGGIIPQPKNIPELVEQLEMIRILINYFIESRIQSLDGIEKYPPVQRSSAQGLYRVLQFELNITCSMESLMSFLSKVYSSRTFFVIKNLNFQKKAGNLLIVNIKIDAVIFAF